MELILLEKVQNLGDLGDRVKVRNGYGRNWLLPQGKALRASHENVETFEKRRADLEKGAQERLQTAQQRAEAARDLRVTIKARVGSEGRLYGSVGPHDVAEAVSAQGIEVKKSEVDFRQTDGVIRQIGEYEVMLVLHADVEVPITVVVEPES